MALGGGENDYFLYHRYWTCVFTVNHLLTVSDSFPAARHDAVTKLDDLWDADDLLGVVTLI